MIGRAHPVDMRARDTGAAALETAIVSSVLIMFLIAVIAFGRVGHANSAIDGAAADGARAASIARSGGQAAAEGQTAARASMLQRGLKCDPQINVDTGGFQTAPGQVAVVHVTIRCAVALGDLAVPGLPGTKMLTATADSSIDTYRER